MKVRTWPQVRSFFSGSRSLLPPGLRLNRKGAQVHALTENYTPRPPTKPTPGERISGAEVAVWPNGYRRPPNAVSGARSPGAAAPVAVRHCPWGASSEAGDRRHRRRQSGGCRKQAFQLTVKSDGSARQSHGVGQPRHAGRLLNLTLEGPMFFVRKHGSNQRTNGVLLVPTSAIFISTAKKPLSKHLEGCILAAHSRAWGLRYELLQSSEGPL